MDDLSAIDTSTDPLNSKETLEKYPMLWNNQGIPIGLHDSPKQTLEKANHNTVLKMIKILPTIKKKTKMLYIGSGYGNTVKYLVDTFSCQIDFLSLDLAKESIDDKWIEQAGLADSVTLTQGTFNNIPTQREAYDLVWAQDVFLYAKNKRALLRKLAHVLQPEGRLIFTEIMKSLNCTEMEGVDLEELTTENTYQSLARRADLEKVYIREFPDQLAAHFSKVQAEIKKKGSGNGPAGEKLKNWIAALEAGCLSWGMLQFQKRNM